MANALTVIQQVPAEAEPQDDNLSQLISFFEESETASWQAREKSERDRDYHDNKQLSEEEYRKLQARGQPPVSLNIIRSRVLFLGGMEKKQRRDPKAWPRNNPEDLNAAEAFTQGMRYVVDRADYATARSQAWSNIVVEGFGGIEIAAVPKADGDTEIQIKRIPWDRLFYDPHSSEPDFSDARYVGQVLWMDYADALNRAVSNGMDEAQAKAVLETTLAGAPVGSQTYEDKPKWAVWADRNRRRVRVVLIWHREASGWKYCEYTKGGKLLESDGPYLDQDGETYCPWVLESANVDRDNNRYGEVRHLIDPQDEINKRQSKALHLLSVQGVIADEGAIADGDINKARRELARPDFWITKTQGAELRIERGLDLAAGHAQLGERVMRYVAEAGPNQALLGKGTTDQSGRAIEAQQAGGLVEQSDLMDTLRRLDRRVFTVIASMMKQFWTGPKWIRVTDNEEAPQWIGLNEPMWTDPASGQTAPESQWKALMEQGAQLPELVPAVNDNGEPQRANDIARLDMDILIADVPDVITPAPERYQAIGNLLASGAPPPVIAFMLELDETIDSKTKRRLMEKLEEMAKPPAPNQQQDDQQRLAKEMAEAKVADTRAAAYEKLTRGEERMARLGLQMPMPDVAEGMVDAQPGGPMGGMPPEMGPVPMGEGAPMPPPGPQGPPEPGLMTGGGPLAMVG